MEVIDTDRRVEHAAQNLQRAIDERGLSYRKLASISGVNYKTIHNFAIGRNDPSLSVVLKLADALQLPLEALLATPEKIA